MTFIVFVSLKTNPTLYITDISCIFLKDFTDNYPARAAYQVAALPRVIVLISSKYSISDFHFPLQGGRVEIEAVAVVGTLEDQPDAAKL